ncbi:MAG TPA: tRNA lysidine(34) synthetase TilS [Candidatus Solibacter sp.]|nr:tRNA lysidine(34) synthetase TilS [Candidatus Solibacter sp.]
MAAAGDRVGVAVSGGADSVALVRLLHGMQDELGIRLAVLHFQHGLRGAESAGDEAFVMELAAGLGLEFLRDAGDVGGTAEREGINLEEAGRRLRTEFFERMVDEGRVTRVATAHTADDQAETVLAHLLRGSGLAGLAGIYPVAGAVVRPLLEVRRAELREWLRSMGQTWREDSTNADTARLRARVRLELLPLLERDFQRQVVSQLSRVADLAREEEQFAGALVEARFGALAKCEPGRVVVRAEELIAPLAGELLPAGVEQTAPARRMVRRAVEQVLGHRRGLTAEHVESVLHIARGAMSGHRVVLPHGVVAARSFDEIIFTAGNPVGRRERLNECGTGDYSFAVALPESGSVELIIPAIGRRLRLKVVDWTAGAGETESISEALDAGRLSPPFTLRNWHAGDVYRPEGRSQPRKLKELLREARVPAAERAGWPVLESGGTLVWVRGLRAAAGCAAGRETRRALEISEEVI